MMLERSQHSAANGKLHRIREVARVVGFNGILLAGLLLAVEVALRLQDGEYIFYARTQPGQFKDRTAGARHWPRGDPDLGWVFNEGAPDFYRPWGLEPPAYATNPQGFRDEKDFTAVDMESGKTRVMMLGDSFLFGVHLDAQDAIPAALERKLPPVEAYNLGIPGWGLDQMYLAYAKYADLIKPRVVVLVYVDEALQRSYEAFRALEGMNKPSFSLQGNRLVARTGPTRSSFWQRNLFQKSILANRLYVAYRDVEVRRLAKALFSELIAEAQRRDERFVVVRVPRLEDYSNHSWMDLWGFKDSSEGRTLSMSSFAIGCHLTRSSTFRTTGISVQRERSTLRSS